MKIHKLEQGTQEWFEVRKGKMTASNAQAIGNNGRGLKTYIMEVVASKYSTGGGETYTNPHMERGNELEASARDIYELETGLEVTEVGFVERDEYSGCSPDGLVEEDGGVEIKCMADKGHFEFLITKKIPSKYMWQIMMCLLVTGRKWWDFVAYNPNFKESLCVVRVVPDKEMFKKLEEGLKSGSQMIKELISKWESRNETN